MNTQIQRVFAFLLLLFATLIYFTSKWTVFDADQLEAKTSTGCP